MWNAFFWSSELDEAATKACPLRTPSLGIAKNLKLEPFRSKPTTKRSFSGPETEKVDAATICSRASENE